MIVLGLPILMIALGGAGPDVRGGGDCRSANEVAAHLRPLLPPVWADIPGHGDDIAYSTAGELAVRRGAVVDVFAVPSGTQLASYPTGMHPLIAYSADGMRLAVTSPDPEVVDTGVRVIDRVNGAAAVELIDDPQTRLPEAECCAPHFKVALTFAGPDRIAVAWSDGRLAAFRLSDGARVWSRLDSD